MVGKAVRYEVSLLTARYKGDLPTVSKSYEGAKCYMAAAPSRRWLGAARDLDLQKAKVVPKGEQWLQGPTPL